MLAEQIYKQLDVKVEGSGPASAVWETLIWKKRKWPKEKFWGVVVLLGVGGKREVEAEWEGFGIILI